MIKAVTIINHLNQSLRLELMRPELSGFIIEEIKGLGPAKAQINFTEMATIDGALDNSARLEPRDIELSLLFLEHPTIEDTRLLSYKYFPIKRNVTFRIETDNRICETVGRVEENVPDIFSENEGCDITIRCPDPYFYSVGQESSISYGVEPLFEFPFSNESLTEKLLEFGEIKVNTEENIFYEGDIEIGLTIHIHAIGPASGIRIYNMKANEFIEINDERIIEIIGSGIQSGDDIIINTNRGEKGIKLSRGGITTNILNALERPIKWFQLSKGNNPFVYHADAGLTNLVFTMKYKTIYEGV